MDFHNTVLGPGWNIGLAAGPLFSTRKYDQYFFGVDDAYATPTRRAYNAKGGYAGAQLLAAVSKRYPSFWIGGFTSWTNLSGAAYADSPLIRQKQNVAAGFAISWVFRESTTKVEAKE